MRPFNSNADFSAHGIFLFAVCGAPVRALIASGYTCVCEIPPMYTDSRCLVTTQLPIAALRRNFFDTSLSVKARQSSHRLAFFPADPLHGYLPSHDRPHIPSYFSHSNARTENSSFKAERYCNALCIYSFLAFAGTLKIILLQACDDSKAVTEDKSSLLLRLMLCFSLTVVTSVFVHLGSVRTSSNLNLNLNAKLPSRTSAGIARSAPRTPRW